MFKKILLASIVITTIWSKEPFPEVIKILSEEEKQFHLKQFKTHPKFQKIEYKEVLICSDRNITLPSGERIFKGKSNYVCSIVNNLLDKKFMIRQYNVALIKSPSKKVKKAYLIK